MYKYLYIKIQKVRAIYDTFIYLNNKLEMKNF